MTNDFFFFISQKNFDQGPLKRSHTSHYILYYASIMHSTQYGTYMMYCHVTLSTWKSCDCMGRNQRPWIKNFLQNMKFFSIKKWNPVCFSHKSLKNIFYEDFNNSCATGSIPALIINMKKIRDSENDRQIIA